MNRLRGLSRGGRLLLAVVVGGSVFGIATAVQASIPSADGVIHGCYQTSPTGTTKGALRVINAEAGEQCRFNEASLNWNQTGPTGARGATGPTGPGGVTALATTSFVAPGPSVILTFNCNGAGVANGIWVQDATNGFDLTPRGSFNQGEMGTGTANAFWEIDFSVTAPDTINAYASCVTSSAFGLAGVKGGSTGSFHIKATGSF
jgi:hypothetical protein